MGQFISVRTSTEPAVIEVIEAMIEQADPSNIPAIIQNLNIITKALQPRDSPAVSASADDLHNSICNALEATKGQANYIFKSLFPQVEFPGDTDWGVVINYTEGGNIELLDAYIKECLFSWDIDPGISSSISNAVYSEVQSCQFTPTTTYGQSPNGTIEIKNNKASAIGYVFWTSSFAILNYNNAIGVPHLMVFYGFSAANSNIAIPV